MRLSGSDLVCVRGGREVFRNLSFAVGAGEALIVTGRNGAGKSSLLRLIAGLLRPLGGESTSTAAMPSSPSPSRRIMSATRTR